MPILEGSSSKEGGRNPLTEGFVSKSVIPFWGHPCCP